MAKGIFHNVETGEITEEEYDSKPTAEELADQAKQVAIRARQEAARTEAGMAGVLKTVTPQQAADYIEQNVTDLASAKSALKLMARMVIAIRDRVMPELPDE